MNNTALFIYEGFNIAKNVNMANQYMYLQRLSIYLLGIVCVHGINRGFPIDVVFVQVSVRIAQPIDLLTNWILLLNWDMSYWIRYEVFMVYC